MARLIETSKSQPVRASGLNDLHATEHCGATMGSCPIHSTLVTPGVATG